MPFRFVANFECATFLKGYTKGRLKRVVLIVVIIMLCVFVVLH